MLTHITIHNLATIASMDLALPNGTTIITGETGAGKSIFIDAIGLALGARATGDLVRAEKDRAEINIVFDIRHLPEIQQWFAKNDLSEDGECIIRRIIQKDGRSKSFINDTPVTLQTLRELCDFLINIHGQHEHQALFFPHKQREMLDKFANNADLLDEVYHLSKEWNHCQSQLQQLKDNNQNHAQVEFLKFQLKELLNLNLKENEFQTLEEEHKCLANADELLKSLQNTLFLLTENEEHNVLQTLHIAINHLEHFESFNEKIKNWLDVLKTTRIQIDDASNDMRDFLENIDLESERLNQIEERIRVLFDVARKHKIKPDELITLQNQLADELKQLENVDEKILTLQNEIQYVEKKYHVAAKKLSEKRAKYAKILESKITELISGLSLPNSQFCIESTNDAQDFSAFGYEKITFKIRTNAGQPLQVLSKIASGGELSRISLAIHVATAEKQTIPALIFDEVDVGISGSTAEIVGKLIKRLGETHQVLCITHLPQVAAQGHQHLLVEKIQTKKETFTHIRLLKQKERVQELARILGGVKITKKTLDHAKEMIEASV